MKNINGELMKKINKFITKNLFVIILKEVKN